MRFLLLAPHHDDVLLSLPAHLLTARSAGLELHVAVCFSVESDALESTCNRLHESLGVRVHCLGLPEATQRGLSLRSCLRPLRRLIDVRDDPVATGLNQALQSVVRRLEPAVCFAPLLPVHLDHALTRRAAETLEGVPLVYYEDQPYAASHAPAVAEQRAGLQPWNWDFRADAARIEDVLRALDGFVSHHQIARLERLYRAPTLDLLEPLWRGKAEAPALELLGEDRPPPR